MIRPVLASEANGHVVFGLTYGGLGVLASGFGVMAAAVIVSVLAFGKGGEAINKNCSSIQKLAHIEHVQVEGQQAQSKALIAKGLTFGLSKPDLERAIKDGEALSNQFLAELDALSTDNC